MNTILLGKPFIHIIFVLPHTVDQIIGHANIKCAILFARHDVDEVGFHILSVIPVKMGE